MFALQRAADPKEYQLNSWVFAMDSLIKAVEALQRRLVLYARSPLLDLPSIVRTFALIACWR